MADRRAEEQPLAGPGRRAITKREELVAGELGEHAAQERGDVGGAGCETGEVDQEREEEEVDAGGDRAHSGAAGGGGQTLHAPGRSEGHASGREQGR